MDVDAALDEDADSGSRNQPGDSSRLCLPPTCEPPSELNPAMQKVWIVSVASPPHFPLHFGSSWPFGLYAAWRDPMAHVNAWSRAYMSQALRFLPHCVSMRVTTYSVWPDMLDDVRADTLMYDRSSERQAIWGAPSFGVRCPTATR